MFMYSVPTTLPIPNSNGSLFIAIKWNASAILLLKVTYQENILLANCLLAGSCWIISSTLKMEAVCSSEQSVATQQTTLRHIPEDDTLHNL
jgi:hypothetical protein